MFRAIICDLSLNLFTYFCTQFVALTDETGLTVNVVDAVTTSLAQKVFECFVVFSLFPVVGVFNVFFNVSTQIEKGKFFFNLFIILRRRWLCARGCTEISTKT